LRRGLRRAGRGPLKHPRVPKRAPAAPRRVRMIYEWRVYTAPEGKLPNLQARFRDHTCRLFAKHGLEVVGFWTAAEGDERRLYYLLRFPDEPARQQSWVTFM